jgi:hypothetical protein
VNTLKVVFLITLLTLLLIAAARLEKLAGSELARV